MAGEDPRGLIPYIRETAQKYGIDPDIAVKVAASEGLGNPVGDKGKSFGAFQLYTGGGLGNEFQKATGLDPGDPKNEQGTIDYALRWASQHGWGPFHGAARVGLSPWQGITIGSGMPIGAPIGAPQPPAAATPSPPQPPVGAAPGASAPAEQPGLLGGGGAPQMQPSGAPAMPMPMPSPLQQLPAFRPQPNLIHLQQAMARFPLLRGYLG